MEQDVLPTYLTKGYACGYFLIMCLCCACVDACEYLNNSYTYPGNWLVLVAPVAKGFQKVHEFREYHDVGMCCAWNSNNTCFAAASQCGTVRIWDKRSCKLVASFLSEQGQACRNIKFSAAPMDLLAFTEEKRYCHLIDARKMSQRQLLCIDPNIGHDISGLAFSPNVRWNIGHQCLSAWIFQPVYMVLNLILCRWCLLNCFLNMQGSQVFVGTNCCGIHGFSVDTKARRRFSEGSPIWRVLGYHTSHGDIFDQIGHTPVTWWNHVCRVTCIFPLAAQVVMDRICAILYCEVGCCDSYLGHYLWFLVRVTVTWAYIFGLHIHRQNEWRHSLPPPND